jgi:PKD repeat protein
MAHEPMNAPDAFERALRNSLEPYEVPYNSADWSQLEKELDKTSGATRSSTAALIALLFGGTMALATTVYLVLNQPAAGGLGDGMSAVAQQLQPVQQPEDNRAQVATLAVEYGDEEEATVNTSPTIMSDAGTAQTTDRSQNEHNATVVSAPVVPAKSTTEIGFRSSITEGCPGSVVEFNVENAPDQKDVLWNFGDGSFSTAKSPKHVFSKAGRFEVVLSPSFLDKPVSGVIVIHEQPEAVFNPMMQAYENNIPHYHFENQSLGGASYHWDFGDGSTSTVRLPNHVYKNSGTYSVSLMVTNAAGCTHRTERTVRVEEDYNLLAAKTFSPNADGVDDTFIPEALKTLGLKFRMTVHDPVSGQLVYETIDPKRPWNGRVGGRGEANAVGDYVWMVEMKDGDKVGGTYTGTISLVR